jgi:hypothetical protein
MIIIAIVVWWWVLSFLERKIGIPMLCFLGILRLNFLFHLVYCLELKVNIKSFHFITAGLWRANLSLWIFLKWGLLIKKRSLHHSFLYLWLLNFYQKWLKLFLWFFLYINRNLAIFNCKTIIINLISFLYLHFLHFKCLILNLINLTFLDYLIINSLLRILFLVFILLLTHEI